METTHFLQPTRDDPLQIPAQKDALYQQSHDALLALQTRLLGELGAAADAYVQSNLFTQHQRRVAWNTARKEIGALSNFMIFLGLLQDSREQKDEEKENDVPFQMLHLAEEPRLWSAITFGLVTLFLRWEREQGYTIKTMNDHLDVIKRYASLAQQAGYQTADQLTAIKGITRIRGSEAKRIDAERAIARIGHKKADPTFLARKEFQVLLSRPDTPQGWRDRVAILLMYDLSLRPSEVVSLTIGHVNMEEGTIQITRHKTNEKQRARLKDRLYDAMRRYLGKRQDLSPEAPLLVRSRKNGELIEKLPRLAPDEEAARQGGRRPFSPNHRFYVQLQPGKQELSRPQATTWTPAMTTRGLREHLHEIGLDIAHELYGDQDEAKKIPRTKRKPPKTQVNLTSYDGRHEWTRSAVRGGSDPIVVTKAGGWKGHSAMVMRYFGELEVINEDIRLER